jgi:RNA polymerase sigma factor (sigma-70 family)
MLLLNFKKMNARSQISQENFSATRQSRSADFAARLEEYRTVREAYELARRIIFSRAKCAGLSYIEAEEVFQVTIIALAKAIGRRQVFRDRLQGWLLGLIHELVIDQINQRAPDWEPDESERFGQSPQLKNRWESEWRHHVFTTALNLLKARIDPKQCAIFECYVIKGWSREAVTECFDVSPSAIDRAQQRVGPLFRAMVERLEKKV